MLGELTPTQAGQALLGSPSLNQALQHAPLPQPGRQGLTPARASQRSPLAEAASGSRNHAKGIGRSYVKSGWVCPRKCVGMNERDRHANENQNHEQQDHGVGARPGA
jgi:hypothetical protein